MEMSAGEGTGGLHGLEQVSQVWFSDLDGEYLRSLQSARERTRPRGNNRKWQIFNTFDI